MSVIIQSGRMELAFDLLADMILEYLTKEPQLVIQSHVVLHYRNPVFQYKHWPFNYINTEVEYA
ncbi:hypothetical protein L1N85_16060 [Paenibacillus alkaliterrae]|uniref:hypothetical protein n=1 Tax=Paenibacillus alkaliterrae TaxID=320909 RepID=UPI001F29D431|nr:hypothetical protein [Paenibacillus alkaliterrae]MCF2939932.1 hypothetical protein [Paenibacillus alkaliterrae]